MIRSHPLYPFLYNNVSPFLSFYKISPMPYGEMFAVLIFNRSLLDGTISSLKFLSNFFLALPDLLYVFQLRPDPIPMGKNSSSHAHVLENIRALEFATDISNGTIIFIDFGDATLRHYILRLCGRDNMDYLQAQAGF